MGLLHEEKHIQDIRMIQINDILYPFSQCGSPIFMILGLQSVPKKMQMVLNRFPKFPVLVK